MSTEQHVFLKDMKSDVNMTKKIFPVSCCNDVLLLILQLMQGAPLPMDDAHINLLLHKGLHLIQAAVKPTVFFSLYEASMTRFFSRNQALSKQNTDK